MTADRPDDTSRIDFTYQQRATAAQLERLNQIAAVLELGRRTFFVQGELFGWKARSGSTGESEFEAATRGSRLANMATHAPAVASAMIRTAGEQLAGLAATFHAGEVFGAPEPLVRSVLENAAYACWVMDPQSTGEKRGARVLAAELTTVDHLRRAIEDVAGTDSDDYKTLSARFDQLRTLADELYSPFTPPKGKDRTYTVGDERYPSFSGAVLAWANGPGGGRTSGRGLYGLLCSDTHPKALAARLNWRIGATPNVAEQNVTVPYLEQLVTAALSPFYGALVCLASYQGWLANPALAEFEAAYEVIAPGMVK
jgi:hypothetical protein